MLASPNFEGSIGGMEARLCEVSRQVGSSKRIMEGQTCSRTVGKLRTHGAHDFFLPPEVRLS
jgi:hypothetical protein